MTALVRGMRRAWRFPAMIAMLFVGLAITVLWFPFLDRQGRRPVIARWSRILLACCGVRVQVVTKEGAPEWEAVGTETGYLLLANHLSWLDVFVINGCAAARFVAKSEIRDWPVAGLLVKRVGTVFIERGKRRSVHHVLHDIAGHLEAPDLVAVFPEGTTSDGQALLPFHGNLIQAAITTETPVLPVGLQYFEPDPLDPQSVGRLSKIPLFIGETTFVGSVWEIIAHPEIVARVTVLAPIHPPKESHRHEVAAQVRLALSQALDLELEDTVPEGLIASRG